MEINREKPKTKAENGTEKETEEIQGAQISRYQASILKMRQDAHKIVEGIRSSDSEEREDAWMLLFGMLYRMAKRKMFSSMWSPDDKYEMAHRVMEIVIKNIDRYAENKNYLQKNLAKLMDWRIIDEARKRNSVICVSITRVPGEDDDRPEMEIEDESQGKVDATADYYIAISKLKKLIESICEKRPYCRKAMEIYFLVRRSGDFRSFREAFEYYGIENESTMHSHIRRCIEEIFNHPGYREIPDIVDTYFSTILKKERSEKNDTLSTTGDATS